MSASSSDGRGRWKRRKRERRSKHQVEEKDLEEDDDEEENNNNDDLENSGDDVAGVVATDPSLPGSSHSQSEVLADGGVRISEFPAVLKRTVNRPHGSVMAIVACERAGLIGDSKVHQRVELPDLENVSHGQLQAVSTEAPVVDLEKYVITPPHIMEGCGVVKRFGSRVHVLPMHSG